jgi:DNA-binding MarR family transcriptional regulator
MASDKSREVVVAPGGRASQDDIMLGVLSAVDRDSHISQRSLSRELGVALGLANAYLKRCVSKGFIKMQHVPHRRYAYYLTPRGFTEKARLTGQYLSASFTFFRRAREQMAEILAFCQERGYVKIVFAGRSELAEVGVICASDFSVELCGIVDAAAAGAKYRGLAVRDSIAEFGAVDAVIVTDLTAPEAVYRSVVAQFGAERVFAPRFLGIADADRQSAREAAKSAAE